MTETDMTDYAELREALIQIDALDPEGHTAGFSVDALRGLIERMGAIARAALKKAPAYAEAETDMTDYAELRRALTVAPSGETRLAIIDGLPDTIAALLAERDADIKRLAFLSKEPVIEGFVGIPKDVYDYACDCAEECGRDEPNDEDMLNGMRRLIDAAIAAEKREGS